MTLARYTAGFADSVVALQAARDAGLPEDAAIRSSSPAMLMAALKGVVPLEGEDGAAAMKAVQRIGFPLSKTLWDAARGTPLLEPFAVLAARRSVAMQILHRKAVFLTEADYDEPRLLIVARTGDAVADGVINPPWKQLLAENPGMEEFEVSVPVLSGESHLPPGLRLRLNMSGPEAMLYRMAVSRGWRAPWKKNRGTIHILRGNELLRETACALWRKGYAIEPMKVDTPAAEAIDGEIEAAIEERLLHVYTGFIGDLMPARAVAACAKQFAATLQNDIAVFVAARRQSEAWAGELPGRRGTAIFTNFPKGPAQFALAEVCRERGIPFVGFQHGIGREICATHDCMSATFENTLSTHLVCFNDEAQKISGGLPFNRAEIISAGLPKPFGRLGGKRSSKTPPLLYVSTNLYRANGNITKGWVSDLQKARREIDLAGKVFGDLPHNLDYKLYPDVARYADGDPVIDALAGIGRINVIDQPIDLRYIACNYRVLITSRATSTVSWCLLSGKPLVFIDYADDGPLFETVRQCFDDSVFLFDGTAPVFHEKLRVFLEQPLDAIEAEWRKKAEPRQDLVDRYFGVVGNAGSKTATVLDGIMSSDRPFEKLCAA